MSFEMMISLPRKPQCPHLLRRKHQEILPRYPWAGHPKRVQIGCRPCPSPCSRPSYALILQKEGSFVKHMQYHCFTIPTKKTPHRKSSTVSLCTKPVANQQSTASPCGSFVGIATDLLSNSFHSKEVNVAAKHLTCPRLANCRAIKRRNRVSSRSRFQTDVSMLERVRELCDETKYPIGSLTPRHNFVKAKTLFHTIIVKSTDLARRKYSGLYNQNKTSNSNDFATYENYSDGDSVAGTVNLALYLLLRICREPWSSTPISCSERKDSERDRPSSVRFCKPSYTNLLFNTWKNAALRNERVLSAIEMTHLLQRISLNCRLRYDFATVGMVLQVALQQSPKHIAPSVVQHIWDTLEKPELFSTSISSVTLSKRLLYFYNALLKAHAESGNDVDDVLRCMYILFDEMRDRRNISPDVVSYNILLRFISRSDLHFDKFEFAIRKMHQEKVQPDLATLFEAVYCYTKFEQLSQSEEYFKQMRDVLTAFPTSDANNLRRSLRSDVGLVSHASKDLMRLYLKLFKKEKRKAGRQEIIDKAQTLVLDLHRQNSVSSSSARYLFRSLVEFYVRFGKPNEAKSILVQIEKPSTDLYGSMIQAYGEADEIDLAMDSFYSMIKDPRIIPNIEIFNLLLNVLAESSVTTPDITDRAMTVLTLLSTSYRCSQLGLKPDTVTYNTFLKCLSKSCHQSIAAQAEAILDEMENRATVDRSLQPNKITYNLAIRIALRMNDRNRIDLFLARMHKSRVSADTRLFNAVLHHYAQIGSTESAQRAESLLIDMIDMGKFDHAIRPNVYSFNIVLNAWAQSEDQVAQDRMWIIYLNMTRQNIELDEVTYHTLISHFVKTRNSLCKADKLLQTTENTLEYAEGSVRLEFVLYTTVINAFIAFSDAQSATRLLFRAMGVYEKGLVRGSPNSTIYHQIAVAWLKLGDIEHASETIYKLHDLYKAHKTTVSPHAKTLNMLSEAWNDSTRPEQNIHLVKIKTILDSQQA